MKKNFLNEMGEKKYASFVLKLFLEKFSAILCRELPDESLSLFHCPRPVPELIDPVFTKTSPKRSFSMTET
jgi:hypothetical protein